MFERLLSHGNIPHAAIFLDGLNDFYQVAVDAPNIARTIAFAIEQPADVAINEMIVRPTSQVG